MGDITKAPTMARRIYISYMARAIYSHTNINTIITNILELLRSSFFSLNHVMLYTISYGFSYTVTDDTE